MRLKRLRAKLPTTSACAAAAALALGTCAVAAGPAAAATGKTFHVTAGGTADCTNSTASNGMPSLDFALACVSNGSTVKIGAGSFGTAQAVSARTTVPADVTIIGAGASKTTLVNTLEMAAGVTATVENLAVDTGRYEAGIINHGTLTVSRALIDGNQGDVVTVDGAGGISNQTQLAGQSFSPSLTVIDSTVSGNLDNSSIAGGIALASPAAGHTDTATVVNSTISGNTGAGATGGIEADQGASLTLRDDTVAGNAGGATAPPSPEARSPTGDTTWSVTPTPAAGLRLATAILPARAAPRCRRSSARRAATEVPRPPRRSSREARRSWPATPRSARPLRSGDSISGV